MYIGGCSEGEHGDTIMNLGGFGSKSNNKINIACQSLPDACAELCLSTAAVFLCMQTWSLHDDFPGIATMHLLQHSSIKTIRTVFPSTELDTVRLLMKLSPRAGDRR